MWEDAYDHTPLIFSSHLPKTNLKELYQTCGCGSEIQTKISKSKTYPSVVDAIEAAEQGISLDQFHEILLKQTWYSMSNNHFKFYQKLVLEENPHSQMAGIVGIRKFACNPLITKTELILLQDFVVNTEFKTFVSKYSSHANQLLQDELS